MKVTFDHTEDIAENITTFWFKPEQEVGHIAGQYGRWYLEHEKADARGERRWFTLSSSPTEAPLISLTTKFNPEKSSTFKTALKNLKPGDQMDVTAPMGDFVLPKDSARPLVFIAGGIGCTPFRSMAKFLADTGEKRSIQFIYTLARSEETAFKGLFESVYSPFNLIVGEPRLTGSKILELAGGVGDKLFYFSGPEPMVEAFVKDCKEKGLPDNQIVLDYFPGYTAI